MLSDRSYVIGKHKLYFLDLVRGLKSEAALISQAIALTRPELIAMSISKEEIEGLKDFAADPFEIEMSRYEELYAKNLSRFGDVFLPPPCFLAGLEEADKAGIPLIGIDMDDETHTEAYCALVSGAEVFRHTARFNFLKLKGFRAEDPAEFAIKWDRAVNNLQGFRALEMERERFMAEKLKKMTSSGKKILVFIDVERAGNVRYILSQIL